MGGQLVLTPVLSPPLPSHPNLAAKSNPKTQCGCTSGVSKLETSSKSVVSISRLPDRETKGRQNEFRVKVLLYFLFIAAIHSLPLCPPPPPAKKGTSLGAASQHCTKSQNVNCRSFVARELLGRSSLYKFFLTPSGWFDSCPRRRHLLFKLGWLFRGKYADIEICLFCDENFGRTLCPFPDKIYKVCT